MPVGKGGVKLNLVQFIISASSSPRHPLLASRWEQQACPVGTTSEAVTASDRQHGELEEAMTGKKGQHGNRLMMRFKMSPTKTR